MALTEKLPINQETPHPGQPVASPVLSKQGFQPIDPVVLEQVHQQGAGDTGTSNSVASAGFVGGAIHDPMGRGNLWQHTNTSTATSAVTTTDGRSLVNSPIPATATLNSLTESGVIEMVSPPGLTKVELRLLDDKIDLVYAMRTMPEIFPKGPRDWNVTLFINQDGQSRPVNFDGWRIAVNFEHAA